MLELDIATLVPGKYYRVTFPAGEVKLYGPEADYIRISRDGKTYFTFAIDRRVLRFPLAQLRTDIEVFEVSELEVLVMVPDKLKEA